MRRVVVTRGHPAGAGGVAPTPGWWGLVTRPPPRYFTPLPHTTQLHMSVWCGTRATLGLCAYTGHHLPAGGVAPPGYTHTQTLGASPETRDGGNTIATLRRGGSTNSVCLKPLTDTSLATVAPPGLTTACCTSEGPAGAVRPTT
ncbi:hypothetical protein Hamer_G025126 [Homarus americanus]|uniref:Uncharacterized protein n=1 Tax=Homarus americanus TaxID=6706 RepID=A0A8J5N0I8_HOMAM|nr:hypothetical protein Hamer_G025126 [Homarus americanus]